MSFYPLEARCRLLPETGVAIAAQFQIVIEDKVLPDFPEITMFGVEYVDQSKSLVVKFIHTFNGNEQFFTKEFSLGKTKLNKFEIDIRDIITKLKAEFDNHQINPVAREPVPVVVPSPVAAPEEF